MKFLYLLLITIPISFYSQSQPLNNGPYYWLTPVYGTNSLGGKTLGLSFFTQKDEHVFGVNFCMSDEAPDNLFIRKHPNTFTNDLALLYGRRLKEHYGQLGLYTGVSLVSGNTRGNLSQTIDYFVNHTYELYDEREFITIGLPLMAEVKLIPAKWLGVGIRAYGNLNFQLPYYGFMVTASFGLLNDRGGLW